MIAHGHREEDVKYRYTIDQVWNYFSDIVKKEFEDRRTDAIIIANAVAVGSPSMDRKTALNKERLWKKFLDSLDPKRIEQRVRDRKRPLKVLASIKEIPIFMPKDKK